MNRSRALRALGFKRYDKPSRNEVEKAFRSFALQYHPDKLIIPPNASTKRINALKNTQKSNFEHISASKEFLLDSIREEERTDDEFDIDPDFPTDHFPTYSIWIRYSEEVLKKLSPSFAYFCNVNHCTQVHFSTADELADLFPTARLSNAFEIQFEANTMLPDEIWEHIISEFKYFPKLRKIWVEPESISTNMCLKLNSILSPINTPAPSFLGNAFREHYQNNYFSEENNQSTCTPTETSFLPSVGVLIGLLGFINSAGLGFIGILLGLLAGCLLQVQRHEYIGRAGGAYYKRFDKDSTKPSDPEITALKAGVRAKHWPGYLRSYFNRHTYTNPTAFTAGMSYALCNKNEHLTKIENLKKSKPQ